MGVRVPIDSIMLDVWVRTAWSVRCHSARREAQWLSRQVIGEEEMAEVNEDGSLTLFLHVHLRGRVLTVTENAPDFGWDYTGNCQKIRPNTSV